MSTRQSKGHREDLLPIAERLIAGAENAGDATVDLNIGLARVLLELAKEAPKARSRPYIPVREKGARTMIIRKEFNRRKKALIAEGVPKGEATERAADAVAHLLEVNKDRLAASTIKRMMERRR